MSTSVFDQPYALLDSTGQRIAQAVEALSPSNVAVDISTSLQASGWTNSSPYTQTWLNNKVSDECGIKVEFLAGAVNDDVLYLEYEKVPGGVKFTAPKKPSHDIPVIVHIINAKAESITSISGDMVSTDVVSGAGNVDEALTAHNEAITTLNTQIANMVNFKSYASTPSVTMAQWASPIYYADITITLPDNITNQNQLIAISHSNQYWIVNATGLNGSDQVSVRIASLTSSITGAYITVFYA